ncbi:MAG TPA: nuclear transport factor 2 family protein [Candidatus Limnocylindria bacterium]|nr:nuclear transport factor 2 family protein [Candidatus Limnocylindria bacterium]
MDSQALKARIADAYASGDFEALTQIMDEMVGDDFVLEYPQSGERFRGWDRIKEMNQSYEGSTGTNPKMTGRSILEPGKAWVFESTIDYGDGTPVSAVTIIEVGPDGKAARQRDYFAYPFEAPEWRAKFSESGEKLTAG